MAALQNPTWTVQPQATQLVQTELSRFLSGSVCAQNLRIRMLNETGTNLFDWLDRLTTGASATELTTLGFVPEPSRGAGVFRHPLAQLPLLVHGYGKRMAAVRVESVVDFLQAQRMDTRCQIVGNYGAAVRRTCIECLPDSELWVVERHGQQTWEPDEVTVEYIQSLAWHFEHFRLRRRDFESLVEGFQNAERMLYQAIADLGRDRACDAFFAAERAYWQYRNDAAQMQKCRQDRLGLGWANHDHHTYRSSRSGFRHLIAVLELMGFECRERFYAGREAGWGAQVLEQPACGIVVFADVDLAPEEVTVDFAHHDLFDRAARGTVGMWCALHGEAFLQAGMHHLECQFDFDVVTNQLNQLGLPSMKPFTDLPHLKQAFTKGQFWPVEERAIDRAVQAGWIDSEQAHKFREQGALGSHLEILQRHDGYRGFNQQGISEVISDTDPRKFG